MNYTIEYIEEDGIILVDIISPLSLEEVKAVSEKVKSLTVQHNSHRILIDHLGVDAAMSMEDMEVVPEIVESVGSNPEDKVVVVIKPYASKRKFRFIKDVLALSSIQIKICYDRDEAVAWLKSF